MVNVRVTVEVRVIFKVTVTVTIQLRLIITAQFYSTSYLASYSVLISIGKKLEYKKLNFTSKHWSICVVFSCSLFFSLVHLIYAIKPHGSKQNIILDIYIFMCLL